MKSEAYLSTAKMRSNDELNEMSKLMGCQEHAYNDMGRDEYCRGITTEMGGMKVQGPPLHQAAATVGSGPKPASPEQIFASHRCKNPRCVNPTHVQWEDYHANMRRKTCVGMVKFNVGGKVIWARAEECTCNGHCLDYVTAA